MGPINLPSREDLKSLAWDAGAGIASTLVCSPSSATTYISSTSNALLQMGYEKNDVVTLFPKDTLKGKACSAFAITASNYAVALTVSFLVGAGAPSILAATVHTVAMLAIDNAPPVETMQKNMIALKAKVPTLEELKKIEWKAKATQLLTTANENVSNETLKVAKMAVAITAGVLMSSYLVGTISYGAWESPLSAIMAPIVGTIMKVASLDTKLLLPAQLAIPAIATATYSLLFGSKLSSAITFIGLTSILIVANDTYARWNKPKEQFVSLHKDEGLDMSALQRNDTTQIRGLEGQLAESNNKVAQLEEAAVESNDKVAQLEEAAVASDEKVTQLNVQISTLQEKLTNIFSTFTTNTGSASTVVAAPTDSAVRAAAAEQRQIEIDQLRAPATPADRVPDATIASEQPSAVLRQRVGGSSDKNSENRDRSNSG